MRMMTREDLRDPGARAFARPGVLTFQWCFNFRRLNRRCVWDHLKDPNRQSLPQSPMSRRTWFIVYGSGYRVQGAGFRVQGAGCRVQGAGCRVQGAGCRVQGSGLRVQGSGFKVQGSGFRGQGSEFRGQGS